MLSFIFAIECHVFEWKWFCAVFSLYVYIFIVVGDPIIKRGGVGISFTSLTPATLLCLSQSRTWITNKYADVDGIVQGVDPGFQARRGALTFFWGYFVWKITILRQKIIFFPILGRVRAGCAPPPWICPCCWLSVHNF